MKTSYQTPDADQLFLKVCQNCATDEEMKQAESLLLSMEQRMEKQIDQWEKAEQMTERHPVSPSLKWFVRVAASLLLVLSVSLVVNNQYQQKKYAQLQQQKDSYDNPEDAAAEAQWALLKFSDAINKAIE